MFDNSSGGFPYPITTSMIHMAVKYLLSTVYVKVITKEQDAVKVEPQHYWRYAVPIGITTALDVALGNLSFLFITVTFYTITKRY